MTTRKAFTFLAIGIAAVGFFWWWSYWRWPVGELQASVEAGAYELDKPVTIVVTTNQPYDRTVRRGVEAVLEAPFAEVSEQRLLNDGGQATFEIDFIPRAVVAGEPGRLKLRRGDRDFETATFEATVPMPLFYSAGEQSFAEMVNAPDASIYGSHISVWNDLHSSEVFVVTGHAASSVCRVASAALFGLARHTDFQSPYAFLGAGAASLDVRGLSEEVDRRKTEFAEKYPDAWQEISNLVDEQMAKVQEFAKLLEQAGGRKLEDKELESSRRDYEFSWLERLGQALQADSQPATTVPRDELQALSEEVAALAEKRYEDAAALTHEELGAVKLFLDEPQKAIAASLQSETTELEPCLEIIRAWDEQRRNEFGEELDAVVERYKAFDTAIADFQELQESSGLVEFENSTDATVGRAEQVQQIRDEVAAWVKQGTKEPAVELAALASGHRGCVLLPYFDGEGKPLKFTLDDGILSSEAGQDWRALMQDSTATEVGLAADTVAQRLQENYDEAAEKLQELKFLGLNASDFPAWLNEEKTVQVRMVNDKGKVDHVESKELSNFELLVDQWQFAAETQRSRDFYRRIAESASSMKGDRRFNEISDACLIDSLLRGWQLSFSDDETERKFSEWNRQVRQTAWAELWKQAAKRQVDLRKLVNEGTVFQVRLAESTLEIVPLFVADLVQSSCVRAENGSFAYYSHPWFQREPVYVETGELAEEGGASPANTPEAFAENAMSQLAAALEEAAQQMASIEDAEDQLNRLTGFDSDINGPLAQDLSRALCAAPEVAVARVAQSLLNLWPAPPSLVWESQELTDVGRLALLDRGDEEGARMELVDALYEGTWPFADEYLTYALLIRLNLAEDAESAESGDQEADEAAASEREQAEKLVEVFIENGRKRDQEFLDQGLKEGKITRQSDYKRRVLEKQDQVDWERAVQTAMRVVVLLSEAQRALEEWDDAGHVDFLIGELSDELRTSPIGESQEFTEQIESDLAVLDAYLDSNLPVGARAPLEVRLAIESIGNAARAAYVNVPDEAYWRLAWRCDYLAGRVSRGLMEPDAYASTRPRVLASIRAAVEVIDAIPDASWLEATAEEQSKQLGALAEDIEQSDDYDALDRQRYRHELSEHVETWASSAVSEIAKRHQDNPSRRTLEMLVQLQWHSGGYREALNTLTTETFQRLLLQELKQLQQTSELDEDANILDLALGRGGPELIRGWLWARLAASSETDILKACVYSGGEFFGTSIFGRRSNDWVKKPPTVHEVVVRIRQANSPFIQRDWTPGLEAYYRQSIGSPDFVFRPSEAPRLGSSRIMDVHQSFTDVRAFRVREANGGERILKVRLDDTKGIARREMEADVEITDYLLRQGAGVAPKLGVHAGNRPKLYSDGKIVMTRELVAPGEQMSELARRNGGNLTPQQRELMDQAALDLAVKGRELPAWPSVKEPVVTMKAMRQKLAERSALGQEHFDIFSRSELYQQKFGTGTTARAENFYEALNKYIETVWEGEAPMKQVAFVHDSNPRNYFLEGEQVTAIDFGDSFVGNVGNVFSSLARRGKLRDYTEYKGDVDGLMTRWEATNGRSLAPEERVEIAQHLAYAPYKTISSDSKLFLNEFRQRAKLVGPHDDAQLTTALRKPENQQLLNEMLADPRYQGPHARQLQDMEHAAQYYIEMLKANQEHLPSDAGPKINATQELLDQIRQLPEGMRIAALHWRWSPA